MNKRTILASVIAAVASGSSLHAQMATDTSPGPSQPGHLSPGDRVITALNAMRSKEGNTVLAPASLDRLFAMLGSGALNETKDVLTRIFGDPEAPITTSSYSAAASVWVSETFEVAKAYVDVLEDEHAASNHRFDPKAPQAALEAVNEWAEAATRGQVTEVLPSLPQNAEMLLVSGAAFDGSWLEAFETESTRLQPFTNWDNETFEVETMSGTRMGGYQEVEGGQVFSLPFAEDGVFSEIILPVDSEAANQCLSMGDPCKWMDFEKDRDAKAKLLDVELPKFEISSSGSLLPMLEGLGLGQIAEAERSDFGAMTSEDGDRGPILSDLVSGTTIAVSEHGVIATSASAAVMTTRTAANKTNEAIEMRIDRPFLFVIRHPELRTPLFMAYVTDPR